MDIDKKTQFGVINITSDAIAQVASNAAGQCYGVVGMASQKLFQDGIAELLKKENYAKGVVVRQGEQNLVLDLFIVVSFGVRISEVVSEVQKKVKYSLEKALDVEFEAINVFVQGVRVMD